MPDVRSAPMALLRSLALLALLACSVLAWAGPYGLAVNSRGNEVDSQRVDALWRVDLATGEAEYIGWTGFFDLEGLALDASGTLFGADDDSKTLVRVSQTSGLAIPVGGQTNRSNMGVAQSENLDFGMAMDCSGRAWVISSSQQRLFRADLASGELTAVGEAGDLGAPISDLAIIGDRAYGIGVGLDAAGRALAPNLYSIDLNSGSAQLVGPLGDAALPYNNAGLAFDEDGVLWAITDRRAVPGGDFPSAILRIDPESGRAEQVAETIVGFESLAVSSPVGCGLAGAGSPLAVPALSPAAILSLMLVLLGLAVVQLRSRHS